MADPQAFDYCAPGTGPVRWFNTNNEACAHAATLEWWIISQPFVDTPDLWRVEEMDGYR